VADGPQEASSNAAASDATRARASNDGRGSWDIGR
jgi:hypothetical protein